MKRIKVGAAVLNQTPLDWVGNTRNILQAIGLARADGVSVLCLPELCITGYGCEDQLLAPGVLARALDQLREIAPASEGMLVALGLPVLHRKAVYDAVCLLADGEPVGLVGKRFLAGDGLHYEPRWFKPWPAGVVGEIDLGDRRVALGDLIFCCDGVRIGFEICEDAWVARRPGSALAIRGVDLILNPSASHFAFGKHAIRRRFVLEGARAFAVSYLYANLVGNESGRAIYDGGALIASGHRLLAEGPRFSFADVQVTSAVVDVDETRMQQARISSFRPELGAEAPGEVRVELPLPEAAEAGSASPAEADGAFSKEEELTRAVALGLFDYLRKSGGQGFAVSLSGGADSSAVSCLAAAALRLAAAELGMAGLAAKLPSVEGLADCREPRELVERLLTCVYQSTRNSSRTTRDAARGVSAALGATFYEIDVDALVSGYRALIEEATGRELTWETDDLALQNLQARTRGPGIWLLANLRGALLLAASNRSEAAVGYATMDGDTCGGLSPIGGIDKAFLRRWLRWMETTGPAGLGPIPELAAVNSQQPTAELRPPEAGQTDEADLMPYDLLDAIERLAIRDKKTPVEVYRSLRERCGEVERSQLAAWIGRFFRLWSRNQWKRERYAPSFHLDDENLDPKTWCRFPILSGGFEQELEELRRLVDRSG